MTSERNVRTGAGAIKLLAAACCAALLICGTAQAEFTYLKTFGSPGFGTNATAGKFNTPAGVAVNQTSGNVYVADRGNQRVQEFTGAGNFIRAWGFDVVKSGEDNENISEKQAVKVVGASGTFMLRFGANTTGPIPFNAGAATVETALNALSSINTGGGSVSVTGGPGDGTGSTPYVVDFNGGPRRGENVSLLQIDTSALGIPTGSQLTCTGSASGASSFKYQWLANGTPIGGATNASYTTTGADAGKTIQCQVAAVFALGESLVTDTPYQIADPVPGTQPPLGPASPLATPGQSSTLTVGGAGGQTLTCNAGTWTNSPETYTYTWYRNGVQIATETTALTSNQYVTSAADVATAAAFQCSVKGTNAGGASTLFSNSRTTSPAPSPAINQPTATTTKPSQVETTREAAPVFEICKANPPSNDVCQGGVSGGATGQLSSPRGIAVDSGSGAVYVQNDQTFRVNEYTAEGVPVLTFGKGVNQTTGGNICTVASGNVCKAGQVATDETPGTFGDRTTQFFGNPLAVDSAGDLYVGDPFFFSDLKPRIQKFDSSANFLGQAEVEDTGTGNFDPVPKSLAVGPTDPERRVQATLEGAENAGAETFHPFEFTELGETATREGNIFALDISAEQVAVDPRNNRTVVTAHNFGGFSCGIEHEGRSLYMYDTEGHEVECFVPSGSGAMPSVNGIAVSEAGTESSTLYATLEEGFAGPGNVVKVFSLPVSRKPDIGNPEVKAVSARTAQIQVPINPEFEETEYWVEYGTEDCSVNSCPSSVKLGPIRGTKDQTVTVPLEGLQPNQQYHFRVVATNVIGTSEGADETFATYNALNLEVDPCSNALARQQTGAATLRDCRAYELVSAENTAGHDVESDLVSGQDPYEGYPDASGRVLYGTHGGGIPGTGNPTNYGVDPYLATRGSDGWSTSYVGIPANGTPSLTSFASTLLEADPSLDTFAFGGKELCDPCFSDGSTNIPLRMPDGSLIKGMAGSFDPAADPAGEVRKPLSADGSHLIFGSEDKFEEGGNEGSVSLYDRDLVANTTQIVSTMPNGETMAGPVAELDVSADGSRVVVGEPLSEDVDGNELFHLYMHIGNNQGTYDLTPSTTTGVLYNGMTEDGSMVYFSTKDPILTSADQDTDESVDLFRSTVASNGAVAVTRVSTGSGVTGDTDLCTPVGDQDWNSNEGAGKCNTLAFAGGAGIAAEDGTVYFLSPERLDGTGNGSEAGEPNLYRAEPGGAPHYVGLLDSSTVKPPPAPFVHSLNKANFITGLSNPGEISVDQLTGDVYVSERGASRVSRYTSAGVAKPFTAVQPYIEANRITGQSLGGDGEGQISVDSDNTSPFKGAVYVTTNGGAVRVYANSGEKLGELTGFGEACGVSVDPANGDVYVGDYSSNVWRFKPISAAPPVTNASYSPKEGINAPDELCNIDAQAPSFVYTWNYSGGGMKQYPKSAFAVVPGSPSATPIGNGVHAQSDPATSDLYVNEGNKITRYSSAGSLIESFGSGNLSSSRGVAIDMDSKDVFATSESGIQKYSLPPPYDPIDNPAIEHALHQSGVHSYGDFQVTPDGRYAAFASPVALTSYDSASHYEVYRYDGDEDVVDCASCIPTELSPSSDSSLPVNGLGLSDDGQVFFNTSEKLAIYDTNGKQDAYQWTDGESRLISSGTSPFAASLLSITASGSDAYFFTRDSLVSNDAGKQTVKIYDAREDGGFFIVPAPPLCAASDECHGPGTRAAGPPSIGTVAPGRTGQVERDRCQGLSSRAKEFSSRAKALRRKAGKASGDQASELRRKASRSAKKASDLLKKAKSCRHSSGGNG
jgi:hypothetical protein